MPAPTYIISKIADPIFAVFIGLSAAATRINREQKEQGIPTSEVVAAGKRRLAQLFEQKFKTQERHPEATLQDRQMQLMLLEQENRKRLAAQNEKRG